MNALRKSLPIRLSPSEYLERELAAASKSEYVNGEVLAMAGASPSHVRITGNTYALLWNQLESGACEPMMNDQRVRTPSDDLYTYPDVLVACNPDFSDDASNTLLNPIVIFEVLSPSTERLDRFTKFNRYRTIPSLRDYVLISQDSVSVEHRSRQPGQFEENWWSRFLENMEEELVLDSINCRLRLVDVYRRVVFDMESDSTS